MLRAPVRRGVRVGRLASALVAVLALGAAACGRAAPTAEDCVDLTAGSTAHVEIADFRYLPGCFTMRGAQGLTVANDDGADHTFTLRGTGVDLEVAGSGSAEIGPLAAEADLGTYDLICRYHPDMRGTVALR